MLGMNKNKEVNNVDRKVFRRRIFAHKARIFSVIFIIVAAIFITGVVLYNSYTSKVYTDYEVVGSVESIVAQGASVLNYQNQFITYSADGIHCTDSKGRDVWSFPYEMQNPMVDVCEGYVAVADYNGRSAYIFNSEGNLGTIQTSTPIKSIKVSGTGVICLVTDEDTITPITLYYYDGTEVASFRTTMSKSGYPLTIGLSDDSKLVGVSYLYVDNGTLTSKVAFYNFGEVGQNETDNLVSGYDYMSEVVPVVDFLDNKTAFAVANDRLMFYEGKERPSNTANILLNEQVQAVFFGDGVVGLLYLDASGESKYRLDLYNKAGDVISGIHFDLEYSDIFFANGRVVIYNASSALIYTQSGNLKYQGDFKKPVSLMIPSSSDTKYVIVTDTDIENIVLK